MRVVVTGASGFIGRNVLLRAPAGWDIAAVYHSSSDFPAFVAEQRLHHVRPLRCDLTDAASVAALGTALGGRVDAALYLAANGDPARSTLEPSWDLRSNALAFVHFLEHCLADHVVHMSSGAVYDGLTGLVTPDTRVSPKLPYAISKLTAEHYLDSFRARRGMPASGINVRFFGAYGPYEAERKVTTRWLRAMAAGAREFTVRGSGENLIDLMHVDDAADGLLRLVEARGTSLTVDFASGSPVTVNQLVETMARALGVTVRVHHEGHTEEFIEFRSADRSMRDRFGVVPTVRFEDGLARLAAFLSGTAQRPGGHRRTGGA